MRSKGILCSSTTTPTTTDNVTSDWEPRPGSTPMQKTWLQVLSIKGTTLTWHIQHMLSLYTVHQHHLPCPAPFQEVVTIINTYNVWNLRYGMCPIYIHYCSISPHLTQSPPIPATSITCRMVGHLEETVLSPGCHPVVKKVPHTCNVLYLKIPLKFDSWIHGSWFQIRGRTVRVLVWLIHTTTVVR